MKLSEFLEAAWKKIEDPKHWTQAVYARTASGRPVHLTNEMADKFCATGACRRVEYETSQFLWGPAGDLLSRASAKLFDGFDVVSVNDGMAPLHDNCITPHGAVKECYALAIKWAKDAENVGCEAS